MLTSHLPLPALLALCLACGSAWAAEPAAEAQKVPDAKVQQTVIEDDSNRIEEMRVRGQTQKVSVQPKNSALPGYEIIMGDASRDPSIGNGASRGAAGQRVWRLLTF
ncbi:hypothetical protein HNP55_004051 [Paucibacter oligotrophus]|uniref:Uncharacterized protein n=1 Tax=Roseateles oligotrophus TaxID=1769250 RepID=A0A840LCP8_9BURK|nr:hypothetical protein [Roseateles oligotrophus]MBB4845501.1 hypothetical protein [Roseateles oligotrophus]